MKEEEKLAKEEKKIVKASDHLDKEEIHLEHQEEHLAIADKTADNLLKGQELNFETKKLEKREDEL